MPRRRRLASLAVCAEPDCDELTDRTYCKQHRAGRTTSGDASGYGWAWRSRIRPQVLRERPWCECPPDCGCGPRVIVSSPTGSYESCGRRADMVDHIDRRRDEVTAGRDPERRENLQALASSPCHGRKTARHDGAFGNPKLPTRRR